MEPMPLPHFLVLLCVVIAGAAVTVWFAASVGVPMTALMIALPLAAGLVRLFTKVE